MFIHINCIISFTGNGQTEPTLPLDEQARFDHVLIKPITSKSLLKVVKMIGFVTPLFTFAAANAGKYIAIVIMIIIVIIITTIIIFVLCFKYVVFCLPVSAI